MPAAIKVLLFVFGSMFSATSAWYVIFETDFVYKSNMTFNETVEAFIKIKVEENHLIAPAISSDGKTVQRVGTLVAASNYYIDYYDTLNKAVYQVKIYQDGYNQKHTEKNTYIRFHSLQYTNEENMPFVREDFKIRQNVKRRKRFEAVVIDKVRADLDKLNQKDSPRNRIKRVIHYLQ